MMADFDYRSKLEGWVEGVLDVFQTYLWTVLQMNLRPLKTLRLLTSADDLTEISSPSLYLVLSYLVMCFLIRDVDFSDPIFSVDIANRLDALGVLNAAKTVKVETLVVSIFPAIMLLVFFVILATAVLRVAGDDLDARLLRRNYSFALGGAFLVIGTVSGGYNYLVKPVAMASWWLGLPLHILTMLPLVNAIYPMLAIQYIGKPMTRQLLVRWIAIMMPLIVMLLILKMTIGSFYLVDYMRLRMS